MAIIDWRSFVVRLGIVVIACALFLGSASTVLAGFGITPPYVSNDRLTRGTVFEQQITLVRSDPVDDLKAEITMNIPGIESWFSVDRGKEFVLPKGETQIPIVIRVAVPEDAAYQKYKGAIRVKTSAANAAPEGGGVSIALGAQIDVAIEVVDQIFDFTVRKIRIDDLEEGRRKWGLFFPGKIRFYMTIENTGNAEYGPSRVTFDIYDSEMENLLETTENTNRIERVPPFEIAEVVAELPTRLPAGRYTAQYTIYKNDEVAQQQTINVSVAAIGTVVGYTGYGFWGLSLEDKLMVVGVIGIPLFLLILALIVVLARRWRRARVPAQARM